MFGALYKGIILGLTLAISSIGPAFFALIQTSLKNGFRSGAALAFGIFLSDLFCVSLITLGAVQLLSDPHNKIIISYSGGILLVVFGIITLFQKHKIPEKSFEAKLQEGAESLENNNQKMVPKRIVNGNHLILMMSKGFVLNIVNPSVIILWITSVGLVSSNKEYTHWHVLTFFAGTLGIVVLTDILKARVADRIKHFLTARVMKIANLIAGIALIIFGLSFIYRELF